VATVIVVVVVVVVVVATLVAVIIVIKKHNAVGYTSVDDTRAESSTECPRRLLR
jgi:hypothetical protein